MPPVGGTKVVVMTESTARGTVPDTAPVLARAARRFGYQITGLILAIIAFVIAIAGFSAGISTIVVWVGIPILAATFVLSKEDEQAALNDWRNERNRVWRNGFLVAVGSWVTLVIVQFVFGWMLRGFLGIPMGQDRPRAGQAPSP